MPAIEKNLIKAFLTKKFSIHIPATSTLLAFLVLVKPSHK